MRAGRSSCKIDWRPTIGAAHGLDILSQLLDLLGRERADEVLLFQEFEKPDESSVLLVAPPVTEARASLQIVRRQQASRASGTLEHIRKRRFAGMLTDEFHQLERRGRR